LAFRPRAAVVPRAALAPVTVPTVGTLLDPIADKMLISAALISLVQVRAVPGWMAILIIGSRSFNTGNNPSLRHS
jgi:hypothetical protein